MHMREALIGRSCTVLLTLLLLTFIGAGCVQRTLTVTSNPPGALVYMNEQELGRTPLQRDFTWYGKYDVQVRMEGYETLHTKSWLVAPIWQWPPFDLVAEFWPFHLKDQRQLSYTLKPATTQPADAATMLARAGELRGQLQSSQHTRAPTPPTTGPTTTP